MSSLEEYEAALQRHVGALRAYEDAKRAYLRARDELDDSEADLAEHEASPGVPLYMKENFR